MNELYRTYEVLIEETVHPDHPKRKTTSKPGAWDERKYAALRARIQFIKTLFAITRF